MALIRMFGDLLHLGAIFILLSKMLRQRSAAGISLKSMQLFAIVFCTRYIDLLFKYVGLYNSVMKIFFIASTVHICYLMKFRSPWKATYDRENDTFRIRYLIVPCVVLALLFHSTPRINVVVELLWTFSQYLESVAILPQIFLLEYTDRYDALTSHYLFCLGAYRVVYMLHWLILYYVRDRVMWVSVISGLVQSLLYVDFFYHYVTQVVRRAKQRYELAK
ncbi:ER lumen retaining receptor-like protein [Leptomonas pyrrhocoris]|uniref:ER lumen protein-retaining receptor n=1 Tax=Leptomonas pyrrhocoris TaxID=157538 RepID=A0A0N0DZN1_LEPPY|nr:ER lumen retaining receptor-like protein [Leptomonas pyrrhocoris]KPA85485.1 ER lumen retaining receptor-like protein [Leptomonas pyrrhocoris]|eukprot:XP_015663924.1 ER lumen retaining receptor-like protein [Leptomonas pyrrhocoris]